MEVVFLIILLVVLAGVVWWRVKAKNSSAASGDAGPSERTGAGGGTRTDGALSGGSAAASADAAGTTGIATAAGFGRPAEPAPPTTADDTSQEEPMAAAGRSAVPPERSATGSSAVGTDSAVGGAGAAADSTGPGTGSAAGAVHEERQRQDSAEWETQWSEASGSAPAHEAVAHRLGAHGEGTVPPPSASPSARQTQPTGQPPVHHPEYTEAHAPTLPGAETAAVEDADDAHAGTSFPAPSTETPGPDDSGGHAAATGVGLPSDAAATETRDRAQSSALVETGADHTQDPAGGAAPARQETARQDPGVQAPVVPAHAVQAPPAQEPAGHLAAEAPYGEGSASAAADGSGPADYTVKGDAGAMVYYEEGHPEYEQARAEVWFESAAHAEAAGFRAPRRRRI